MKKYFIAGIALLLALLLAGCDAENTPDNTNTSNQSSDSTSGIATTKGDGTDEESHEGSSPADNEIEAKPIPTDGLEYAKNEDGISCSVIGIGKVTATDIVIADTYEDMPVTSVGERAFAECSNLTSVMIPEGVTSICEWAFSGCTGITSMTIPDSLTVIKRSAFLNCTGLIQIEDGVHYVDNWAISREDSVTSVTLREGICGIGDRTFWDCSDLTSITISNTVKHIGYQAFYYCDSLTSITIPHSVISLGDGVFTYCEKLTSIKYEGTIAEWRSILKTDIWDEETPDYTITCTDGIIAKDGTVTLKK